jgi:hypothetical protein
VKAKVVFLLFIQVQAEEGAVLGEQIGGAEIGGDWVWVGEPFF